MWPTLHSPNARLFLLRGDTAHWGLARGAPNKTLGRQEPGHSQASVTYLPDRQRGEMHADGWMQPGGFVSARPRSLADTPFPGWEARQQIWQPVVSRGSCALETPTLVATAWPVAVFSAVIVFIHTIRRHRTLGKRSWRQSPDTNSVLCQRLS
ncbi:hypothetical protein BT67DRAFT_17573 [Trichocladium antarcticum]|uniref:Uncharacterized protein n=1 Tax=Trichocladium antarcticum TaxID=1450529 RepID=A0AAN6UT11_9PEZI|nr:hypothetical protein BT67DRAFT_17573 [Trichocladium antarcticum]